MTEPIVAPSKTESSTDSSSSCYSPPSSGPTSSQPPEQEGRIKDGFLYNIGVPLLLLTAAGLSFWLLGDVESSQRPPADMTRKGRLRALTPVRVERLQTLKSTGQPLYLVVDGTVVPFREAKVAAEVAGRIVYKSESCEAGTYVKRDELLMRIDPADHELEVERLTRLQEQEYQAIQELDQEMANAQRLIDVAKQDVVIQQREVQRQTSLPEGFASRQEIDQANRALLAATQQLVTVENQLQLQRKRRIRLEATERLAATQLQAAELNLKRTEIRAPIEGVIVTEDSDLNTFVARGNVLLTIEDTSKVEVATSLRMDQLYWVLNQVGVTAEESSRSYDLPETPANIEYELSGRDGLVYRWQGRLLSYNGIGLDPITRTVPVRVLVDHPTEYIDAGGQVKHTLGAPALVRGMFVRVKLRITPQTPLVVIPATALQPGNRVMQFIPDESVLDKEVNAEGDDSDNESSNGVAVDDGTAKQPQEEEGQTPFDAQRWEPGRAVIRKSVHPVDTLTIDTRSSNPSDSGFETSARLWVCEVRDAELDNDSFVVVSPVGSVEDETFPVRADRGGMVETADSPQATATTDGIVGNGEDA